jgi:hypothetical protein
VLQGKKLPVASISDPTEATVKSAEIVTEYFPEGEGMLLPSTRAVPPASEKSYATNCSLTRFLPP